MSEFEDYSEIEELQDETAGIAKKTFYLFFLAASSAVATCVLLLQGFKALIGSTHPVNLVIIDVEVPLRIYIWVAPLVILKLLIAGHAFLGRLEARANENIFPPQQNYFFTTRTSFFQALSDALLYLLPILFFWLIYIYLFFRPEADFLFVLLLLVGAILPTLHFMRFRRANQNWRRRVSWAFFSTDMLFLAASIYIHQVLNAEPFRTLHHAIVHPNLSDTNFTELLDPNNDAEATTPVNLDGRCLAGADFSDLDLSGSSFRGANLKGATFANTTLNDVDFSDAYLFDATFRDVVAERANFSNSYLGAADFLGARTRISRSSFDDASLKAGTLTGPIFVETSFRRAVLQGLKVRDATFSGGTFRCADFQSSLFLHVDMLNSLDASLAQFNFAKFTDVRIKKVDLTAASFWNASIPAKAVHLSKDELSLFSEREKLGLKDPETFKLIMADVTLKKVFGLLPLWGRIEFLDSPKDADLIDRTRNAELNNEQFQELCGVNFIDMSKTKQLC